MVRFPRDKTSLYLIYQGRRRTFLQLRQVLKKGLHFRSVHRVYSKASITIQVVLITKFCRVGFLYISLH